MRRFLRYFNNYLAKWTLSKYPGINISPSSRVAFSIITPKTGCQLTIGNDSMVEGSLVFDREGAIIQIGERTFIGGSTLVCAEKIVVGDDVLIAWGSTVVDHNSHAISSEKRSNDVMNWLNAKKDWEYVDRRPVIIHSKAWVGFNVIILKGVIIGEGAVIGAGSVVTKDVPPYTIAAGNPAKTVREIPSNDR